MHWSSKARLLRAQDPSSSKAATFVYPAAPGDNGGASHPTAVGLESSVELLYEENLNCDGDMANGTSSAHREEMETRVRQAHEEGRRLGFREGRAKGLEEFQPLMEEERQRVQAAMSEFSRETRAYYQRVEREVVQLALGVARKVLHREAKIDSTVLAGVVRVALEKIAAGSSVKLRVPAPQAEAYRRLFADGQTLGLRLEIIPDPLLEGPRCELETEVGTADLSVEAQLKEIETGFMDLLAARPTIS